MNRQDLIEKVSEETHLSKKIVERVIISTIDRIKEETGNGEKVAISGFGTFEVKTRAARKGINPGTQKTIDIKASKNLTFRPSKSLKVYLDDEAE